MYRINCMSVMSTYTYVSTVVDSCISFLESSPAFSLYESASSRRGVVLLTLGPTPSLSQQAALCESGASLSLSRRDVRVNLYTSFSYTAAHL